MEASNLPGTYLMLRVCLALCAMIAALWSNPAEARRAALIIGNSAYLHSTSLANPANDAQLVASSARRAGFEVTLLSNLTKQDFDQSLREFRRQADGADVAMIYFAGHGLESGGNNWLLPVDVQLKESRDLRFEAIELDGLLETLRGARLRMVILDACRNNAFGNSWQSGTRSSIKGLAEMEIEGALVMHAAAAGQVAADGVGSNSPFASSLASRLAEPGLSIHRLGSVVLEDVMAETGGQQRPWTNMSIASREFFLVAPKPAAPQVQLARVEQPTPPATANSEDRGTIDALTWQGAATANTLEGYRAYVRNFSNGIFANMARERIAALQGARAASAEPSQPPPQPSAQRAVELASVSSTAAPLPRPVTPAPALAAPAPDVATPAPAVSTSVPAVAIPASAVAAPAPAVVSDAASPSASDSSVQISTIAPADPVGANSLAGLKFALREGVPLPAMPSTPRFPTDGYPTCRESYQAITDPIDKVEEINRCTGLLDQYSETVLNGFARDMIQHQKAINRLFAEKVAESPSYTIESQDRFYKAMLKEHAASVPGGANFAEHAIARARFDKDRAYLADRYCFHTGRCGGYAVPAGVAPPTK